MFANLPAIIYTIKLEPFINIIDANNKLVKSVEVNDLPNNIRNVVKLRIKDDFRHIISQTVSIHFKVSAYNYNENTNTISIDFIVEPEDIKKKWMPDSENSPDPQDRTELLTTVRNDVADQIDKLYGQLANDTWRRYGESTLYTDEQNLRYDMDLRLLSVDSFFDTRQPAEQNRFKPTEMTIKLTDVQPEIEPANQNGGDKSYYKYMKYKAKYVSLKNKKK